VASELDYNSDCFLDSADSGDNNTLCVYNLSLQVFLPFTVLFVD